MFSVFITFFMVFIFIKHILIEKIIGWIMNRESYDAKIKGMLINDHLAFGSSLTFKLNKSLMCGVYSAKTDFGNATLLISRFNGTVASVYFDKKNTFKFSNFSTVANGKSKTYTIFREVSRLTHSNKHIIKTYNKGCNVII